MLPVGMMCSTYMGLNLTPTTAAAAVALSMHTSIGQCRVHLNLTVALPMPHVLLHALVLLLPCVLSPPVFVCALVHFCSDKQAIECLRQAGWSVEGGIEYFYSAGMQVGLWRREGVWG